MKKYIVTLTESGEETIVGRHDTLEAALQLAPYKAEDISLETAEIGDINCCITDVEDI